MTKEEVLEKLTPIFRSIFKKNDLVLTENMSAEEIDSWDSLTHMLLITEVENTFEFQFQLKELRKSKSIEALVDIIIARID